jgi:phosphoglycerate dehydrogenase-like enzyme
MRVLYLGSDDQPNWDPWGANWQRAVSREHEFTMLEPGRPPVEVLADPSVDAVIDPYLSASPELAAAAAGHVKLWQIGSVGYDKLNLGALEAERIPVANQPGFTSSRGLAEHALLLAMLVLRRSGELAEVVAATSLIAPVGRQLSGRTLLVIGLGASGRQIVRRARAMDMQVIAVTRRPDPDLARRIGLRWIGGVADLPAAVQRADVTSLHVPLTAETRGILTRELMAAMPRGAVVVNVSRGGLIDEAALADLVRSGHLYGAGIDTAEGEPAPPDHVLRGVPNLVITPHVAGATVETSRRRARFGALNISRVRAGLEPLSRIDRPLG